MKRFNLKITYSFIIAILLLLSSLGKALAQHIFLNNLNAFEKPSSEWRLVQDIAVNPFLKEPVSIKNGSGILVGSSSSFHKVPSLTTKMNHGDLSIEFDVLLTKGASASIWLQGRYGLNLADNWNTEIKNQPKNGALISPPAKGVESIGYTPRQNVGRAPGLWQHVKIVFQSPRFDKNGNKIRNAKFMLIRQNGISIQENQILPRPSKGARWETEVQEGPIEFRLQNGTVAFRNFKCIKSSGKRVRIEDLSYKLYEDKFLDERFFYSIDKESSIRLPDLESRNPTSKGNIDIINTQMTKEVGRDFALVFDGQIHIPESGKYHLEVVKNGIGALELGEKEKLTWDAYHKKGNYKGDFELREGNHPFKLTVVNFGDPKAGIFVNGPGIINQPLHQLPLLSDATSVRPIVLQPQQEPLIQRSFIFFDDQKLLNCLNVGYPEGIHYSFNLYTGALLQVWKGEFGDVTSMWHDRGLDQVLKPMGSILTLSPEQQVSLSDYKDMSSSVVLDYGDFRMEGYDINQKGEPVFQYTLGNIGVRDVISLGSDGQSLTRSLQLSRQGEVSKSVAWYEVAKASKIEQVDDRLYAVGDKSFFLRIGEGTEVEIKQEGNSQTIFVPISIGSKPETFRYSLIW